MDKKTEKAQKRAAALKANMQKRKEFTRAQKEPAPSADNQTKSQPHATS